MTIESIRPTTDADTAAPADATFDPSRIADPRYFAEYRRRAHSSHAWYRDEAELASGSSGFVQSLDGTWKLSYSPSLAEAVTEFAGPGVDVSAWHDVQVPGHIQLQGFDRPQYVNVQYPWDGLEQLAPGEVPQAFNPTATYVRTFGLDRPLETGERVSIVFEGAESAVAVWVNGAYVGFSADTFTPSGFDVTDALVDGENTVAARVFKWVSGSWLEDQDFFRFSGLFRSVVLERRPVVHVEDLRVTTLVEGERADGAAEVVVELRLTGEGQVALELEGVGALELSDDGRHRIRIAQPELWSPEHPHLYRLLIRVSDEQGALTEVVAQPVGVRRFGIEQGVLTLNGSRVVFHGVNRHEFGVNGRVVTREETEHDLALLKRTGVNAIRTSHYPNNAFFYDLADEYGFLVIDETNLETHGVWDSLRRLGAPIDDAVPGDKAEWWPLLQDRAQSMFERDKNHASVVIWSCGNESFGGTVIRDMAAWFRSVDDRPVHYEGVHWDPRHPETTDIRSEMYTPAATVEAYLAEHRDKPFVLCEYAHAMGNSFGAVDRYLDLADREPLFQGGFIWDFADQALPLTDRHGVSYMGYGGDFGDRPHDGDFSGNGILFADRTPKPFLQEVAYLYAPVRVTVDADGVTLRNRLLATSTAAFDTVAVLRREGVELASASIETDVAPGDTEHFALPFSLPADGGEVTVDVELRLRDATRWADAGFAVAAGQGVVTVGAPDARPAAPKPVLVEGVHNVGVHGDGFAALFSRLAGGLVSFQVGPVPGERRELLESAPKTNFWHAPTSNERGWGGTFENGQWLLASRYARAVNPDHSVPDAEGDRNLHTLQVEQDDASVTVRFTYELPTVPVSYSEVAYRVTGDGRIAVTVSADVPAELPDLPEFGMLVTTDADLHTLRWYGDGPEESAIDRRLGTRVDVFEREVTELLPAYLKPQESGGRTGVRWAEVTGDDGAGIRFDAVDAANGMEFSALPWTPFEVENAMHPNELPAVQRTVLRPVLRRRGVAGDDSWGARPHEEYLLPSGRRYEFTFELSAVTPQVTE